MTSLRTATVASLAVLSALLAGCGGPSDEELALRARAMQAETQAAAAQAQAAKLASAPSQPDPGPTGAEEPAQEDIDDGPVDTDPIDDTNADPEPNEPPQQAALPPEVPMMQPPAVIDVPRPEQADALQPTDDRVEYVRVRG